MGRKKAPTRTLKACASCGKMRLLADFCYHRLRPGGRENRCRQCKKAYDAKHYDSKEQTEKVRRWKEKNPDKYRNAVLKAHYGITLEAYNQLLAKQKHKCAICNQDETAIASTGKIMRLAVDHCHKYGIVRGLLCSNCNRGIGCLKDDKEILYAAIKYLEEYE